MSRWRRTFPKYTKFGIGNQQVHQFVRKHPSVIGIPFLVIIVGASFALTPFTQTRYDLDKQQRTQMTKEQELRLEKDKRRFDLREAYYKLGAGQEDEGWEPTKRIPRPPGLPEWGVAPTETPSKSPDPTRPSGDFPDS